MAARFDDGVWLAELAAARRPGRDRARDRPGARGVRAARAGRRSTWWPTSSPSKDLLLVLDNAEHLIDGVARIAERLLAAPGLRIMTTSREALAVPGEAIVQVPSLSCPPDAIPPRRARCGHDLRRGVRDRGGHALRRAGDGGAPVLRARPRRTWPRSSEICRRLDGIPLAIELAAGARRGDVARGDRGRPRRPVPAAGRRPADAVPRQQTLHALIDWSWDLLTDDDRRLLRRLSIFGGGWTVAAAAGSPASRRCRRRDDGRDRRPHPPRRPLPGDRRPGATTRYRMLETIRQYAREQLIASGEAAVVAGAISRSSRRWPRRRRRSCAARRWSTGSTGSTARSRTSARPSSGALEAEPEVAVRMGIGAARRTGSRASRRPTTRRGWSRRLPSPARILAGPPPTRPATSAGSPPGSSGRRPANGRCRAGRRRDRLGR